MSASELLRQDIAKLAELQAGWHDGDGVAVSAAALRVASELCEDLCTLGLLVLPGITPTLTGGIDITWHAQHVYCEIEADGWINATRLDENGATLDSVRFRWARLAVDLGTLSSMLRS